MLDMQPIRARLRPTFRPFTIRTSDGRGVDILDYLFIAIGRRVVSVIDQEDRVQTLYLADIADIEEVTPRLKET